MTARILICVLCHNRKVQTRFALETLADAMAPGDELRAYNDGSTEYDGAWLANWADHVVNSQQIGTESQRFHQLQEFRENDRWNHLYFTDNDTIHDPTWRENALRIQQSADVAGAPLCLYNTLAHSTMHGNTIEDDENHEVIWRRYAPGVSYLLTRAHVARLNLDRIQNFDWHIPDQLGNRFAVTRTSYLDHIGIGGLRHPADAGPDGGDRALNPTSFLVEKRKEVVKALAS